MGLKIKRYLLGLMVIAFSIFAFATTFNDLYYHNGSNEYLTRCFICSFVLLAIGCGIIYWGYKTKKKNN